MDTVFCIETVDEAQGHYAALDIFNTDQGSQFTGGVFIGLLEHNGIAISMDGRGCWRDNVFVERLWKSVKYEEVYPSIRIGVRSKGRHRPLIRVLQFPAAPLLPRQNDPG